METLNVNLSGEQYLDALDAAAEALDRDAMARLTQIAFARKDLKWQAAARHADNYIVATQRGNRTLQESCQDAFLKLVAEIRNS